MATTQSSPYIEGLNTLPRSPDDTPRFVPRRRINLVPEKPRLRHDAEFDDHPHLPLPSDDTTSSSNPSHTQAPHDAAAAESFDPGSPAKDRLESRLGSSSSSSSSSLASLELRVPERTTAVGKSVSPVGGATRSPKSASPPPASKPHYRLVHVRSTASILSRDPAAPSKGPSYNGFKNLAMIALVVGNIRLLMEDYRLNGGDARQTLIDLAMSGHDLWLFIILTASVPFHLFIALAIERAAAHTVADAVASHSKRHLWGLFAVAHAINAALVLAITSYTVWTRVWSPGIGTLCECHAIIVCLKVASYALTNRDLRDALVAGIALMDPMLSKCPYPNNLTLSNLAYFWWAPTLVYQPVYPRWPTKRRWGFMMARGLEIVGSLVLMWLLSTTYANPILEESLVHLQDKNLMRISECLMKLASISMVIWLLGFFCLFQSYLNLIAELVRFGDREFYQDWWNSGSVGTYWKKWNKPVHNYFLRHFYIPLLKRGYSQMAASLWVFLVSAVVHEIAVGVPTQNIIGVAFFGMIAQIPLVMVTAPLEKMGGTGEMIGNCIFWLSFFLGQPMAVLLYYFAWNMKHRDQLVMPPLRS